MMHRMNAIPTTVLGGSPMGPVGHLGSLPEGQSSPTVLLRVDLPSPQKSTPDGIRTSTRKAELSEKNKR